MQFSQHKNKYTTNPEKDNWIIRLIIRSLSANTVLILCNVIMCILVAMFHVELNGWPTISINIRVCERAEENIIQLKWSEYTYTHPYTYINIYKYYIQIDR